MAQLAALRSNVSSGNGRVFLTNLTRELLSSNPCIYAEMHNTDQTGVFHSSDQHRVTVAHKETSFVGCRCSITKLHLGLPSGTSCGHQSLRYA